MGRGAQAVGAAVFDADGVCGHGGRYVDGFWNVDQFGFEWIAGGVVGVAGCGVGSDAADERLRGAGVGGGRLDRVGTGGGGAVAVARTDRCGGGRGAGVAGVDVDARGRFRSGRYPFVETQRKVPLLEWFLRSLLVRFH